MIRVLRLGHRIKRDVRITTHVCLAARALGASGVVLSGERDDGLMEGVRKVVYSWGGNFVVEYREDWRASMEKARKSGCVVHLTMYGEPIQKKIAAIRKEKEVLVVVGAGKVPIDAYNESDFNIAVTSQPHSEVAALAIFLHEYYRGKELEKTFDGKVKIVPKERGKCVVSCE